MERRTVRNDALSELYGGEQPVRPGLAASRVFTSYGR